MKKQNAIFKPVDGFKKARWYRSPLLVLIIATGLAMGSCGQIKYIPVQGETVIEYRDSIITKLDTVTAWKTKIETVRDYTGLLDTLKLSTANAEASAWIDTTKGILTGSLKDKDIPLEVVVPSKEEYHQKDSVVIQEVPIPVEIEKIKKIYPKWMVILSILGIILTGVGLFQLYLKFRTKLPL